MDIELFDVKYKQQGGMEMLRRMMSEFLTLSEIAKQFVVSKERARQWTASLLPNGYDSIRNRREKRVEMAKKIVQDMGIEKARLVCNVHYLKMAEEQLRKQYAQD